MRADRYLLALGLTAVLPVPAAMAQGQQLEACARGKLEACFKLLQRPRLDPGRRAAIEFHLSELERLLVACSAGETTACTELTEAHPELPRDLRPSMTRPSQ